ncbi:hypothetical protein AB751O23_CF_00020 [Chlamydiales bacterium SCGC AB-751-O23]|nr:hypothetical protein AB751O23_CF_00020 [Chlamydiales bacterium SCGC AB-751-O23]
MWSYVAHGLSFFYLNCNYANTSPQVSVYRESLKRVLRKERSCKRNTSGKKKGVKSL